MHANTSYLTKYISWAGLNVSLCIFRQIMGTFKFKKMMSYSDCLHTEGSQHSQRSVRCNLVQPSQAAAMWLIISLLTTCLIRVLWPWQMLTCDQLNLDTCIHHKSTLGATTSRTYHLNKISLGFILLLWEQSPTISFLPPSTTSVSHFRAGPGTHGSVFNSYSYLQWSAGLLNKAQH